MSAALHRKAMSMGVQELLWEYESCEGRVGAALGAPEGRAGVALETWSSRQCSGCADPLV